jgi:prophage antirepressor-like protein/arsenate reductase-like glutaredoxin family protein
MEIVKAFAENELHTEIVIRGTINHPLFRASDIGEILEISNIRSAIQHFDDTERHVVTTDTSTGPKQVTFLTEKGLYKVLFKSRKPIAETFQNWICEVIKEIRLNGKYELEKQLEQANNKIAQIETASKKDLDNKVQLEREKNLLRDFGSSGSLIYIIKVKTHTDGTYVVKIGESRIGVQNRYNEHKTKYDEVLLLDCFAAKRSKDFESFIHNHEKIYSNRITDLSGHENERELFLIGKSLTYKMILQVINENIKKFNEYDFDKMQATIDTLLQIVSSSNQPITNTNPNYDMTIQLLLKGQQEMMKLIQNLEKGNKEILEKLNASQMKTTTVFNHPLVTLGPRLQQINPENLTLTKVYESIAECLKESNFVMKRPSIVKAINENTVYNGYRWAFVDRDADPTILTNIQPTKKTHTQNVGYVAKLNADKSEILNVYIDRKTAAKSNNYESLSALDNPVKNGSLTNGNYYVLYEKCSDDLKDSFVQKHGEPILYKDGVGQYDQNNNLVCEFVCKYECIKQLKMSDKSLAKALDANVMYNNYYFKRIGSKLYQ